jgi:hypothetical protein
METLTKTIQSKKDTTIIWKEYNYIIKVIYSCESSNQFTCCFNMIKTYKEKIKLQIEKDKFTQHEMLSKGIEYNTLYMSLINIMYEHKEKLNQ